MIKKILFTGLAGSLLLTVASCVDDKYDLDDIDTTSAIRVDNLTIPVRLESITLDQVLDIDENDPDALISVMTDPSTGKKFFAISKDGKFSAQNFKIDPLESTNGAKIDPLQINLGAVPATQTSVELPELTSEYIYHLSDVDPTVESVSELKLSQDNPMFIDLTFTSTMSSINISDLVIKIPEDFQAKYMGNTIQNGVVNVGSLNNGSLPEPIEVYGISVNAQREGSEMTFEGNLQILSGKVAISGGNTDIDLIAKFSMSGFVAEKISGIIDYSVENPEINAVDLGDVPDFLSESGTNLELQNPQLYLYISNPTTADISALLNITPVREETPGTTYNSALDFNTNIILAPNTNDLFFGNDYPGATKTPFEGLKYILAGDGIPSKLEFSLENTQISGEVLDFQLVNPNTPDGSYELTGKYNFFTPLALGVNSKIIYTETETELFGDDVKDIEVDHLQISAVPQTDIPFDINLELYPLDKRGNYIKDNNNNIVVASATVHDGQLFNLDFNNTFTGLDGVYIKVTVDNMNGEALNPDQHITLNNLKATVSGKYITDF